VEQELLTLPEHLSSPAAFSGARVIRSLIFLNKYGGRRDRDCTVVRFMITYVISAYHH
jgi:hypothetical protein